MAKVITCAYNARAVESKIGAAPDVYAREGAASFSSQSAGLHDALPCMPQYLWHDLQGCSRTSWGQAIIFGSRSGSRRPP